MSSFLHVTQSLLLSLDKKDLKSCDESLNPGSPGRRWLILLTSVCVAAFLSRVDRK